MAGVAGELRPIEKPAVALRFVKDHWRKLLDFAPHRQQARDARFDQPQRLKHMGHALAREILKVAGFENLDHAILDVVGEAMIVAALQRNRERLRGLIDRLRCMQDRVRDAAAI